MKHCSFVDLSRLSGYEHYESDEDLMLQFAEEVHEQKAKEDNNVALRSIRYVHCYHNPSNHSRVFLQFL